MSSTWLGKYRDPRRCYQARNAVEWEIAGKYWGAGLPMVVDFTCATWSHGGMSYVVGREPAERAFVKDCHFMYYSLVTPEGERFPWLGLNPEFVPPAELVGIMNAKRDIFAMQDLFAPRERGISAVGRLRVRGRSVRLHPSGPERWPLLHCD